MRSIKIIADSGSNLNERLCREIDAVSVPLTLTVDGRDFVDTFDLDVAEFLEAVEASPNVARSACPSPAAYAQEYEGADEVYVFTLSSKLSGSYQSAMALSLIHISGRLQAGAELLACAGGAAAGGFFGPVPENLFAKHHRRGDGAARCLLGYIPYGRGQRCV